MSATSGRDTRSTRPGSSSHGGPCMPSAAKGWRTFPSPPCGGGSCICSLPPCGGGLGWGVELLVCIVLPPPHPSPPPQGGREFCFSLPHKGGGSFVFPSPTRGEGVLFFPPPQGGGSFVFPSPTRGREFCPLALNKYSGHFDLGFLVAGGNVGQFGVEPLRFELDALVRMHGVVGG